MINKLLDLADLWKVKRDKFKTHDKFLLAIKEKVNDHAQSQKDSKTKILQEINRLNTIVKEIDEKIKSERKWAKLISDEFEYRTKAKRLFFTNKKKVNFATDELGTFWVYGNYEDDDTNDPYYQEHYCDTWSEVFERVKTYIYQ